VLIYLIRHGETDSNARRIVQLPTDPLSARGLQQASSLADRIAACGIKRLVSSDLARAATTASCIARAAAVTAEFDEVLRERDFGDLRGTPYDLLPTDPFAADYRPPGGESWDQFHARVDEAWNLIVRVAQEAYPVAIVTHGLVLRCLLERHLAIDLDDPQAAATARMIPNTSVTIVEHGATGWCVRSLACTEHLGSTRSGGGAV